MWLRVGEEFTQQVITMTVVINNQGYTLKGHLKLCSGWYWKENCSESGAWPLTLSVFLGFVFTKQMQMAQKYPMLLGFGEEMGVALTS